MPSKLAQKRDMPSDIIGDFERIGSMLSKLRGVLIITWPQNSSFMPILGFKKRTGRLESLMLSKLPVQKKANLDKSERRRR